MSKSTKHGLAWGDWLNRRAIFVGFRSAAALGAAVGCTRERIHSWRGAAIAPSQMRKGFDVALARALRTDQYTLLTGYKDVAPEQSPLVDGVSPVFNETDAIKREVHAVVELLDADKLRDLHERGRELLKQEMAASAA